MSVVTMKNLLESGVHFGHQTRRWDPRMSRYIFAERNGIHIIDLQKTIVEIKNAYEAVRKVVLDNKHVLFVGTKKQARNAVKREAEKCGQFYVNHRWLGGMLTNFATIRKSIVRLKKIEKMEVDGTFDSFGKKEKTRLLKEKSKLEETLGGIKNMDSLPGIIYIVDSKKESIAVSEARKLRIPIVAIVDTNCNPDDVNFPIPGNDDAIRAIELFCSVISKACIDANNEAGINVFTESTEGSEETAAEGNIADGNAIANEFEMQFSNRKAEESEEEKVFSSDDQEADLTQKKQSDREAKKEKTESKNKTGKEMKDKKDKPAVKDKPHQNKEIKDSDTDNQGNSKTKPDDKKTAEKPVKDAKVNPKKSEEESHTAKKQMKDTEEKVENEKKVKKEGDQSVNVSMEDIKRLRELTSAGMMDCKKSLIEANGDFDQAFKILKEKGLADAKKRSNRETKEGGVYIKRDGNKIAIALIGCETDFVANNDLFKDAKEKVLDGILASGDDDPTHYADIINDVIAKIKENIEFKKAKYIEVTNSQYASVYIHGNNKIGVISVFDQVSAELKNKDEFKEVANNISLHIAANSPYYLTNKEIPANVIEEQRTIMAKQMEETGKPKDVVDKIVDGKLSKFYSEVCLLDQKFVKDDKISIKKYLADASKELNADIKLISFIRYMVGELI